MRSNKQSIKYFPFAPGIPWKISNGKYVLPELGSDAWHRAVHGRDAIVVSHGGLIESFISLSYFEVLNMLSPSTKLFWYGDKRFNQLVHLNGLAKICDTEVTKETFDNYPTPIFLDRGTNVYFNCLNNYLDVKSYFGTAGYRDKAPIIKQLFRNSTLPWEMDYIPRFRNEALCDTELAQWSNLNRFNKNQQYICVFPDKGLSQHSVSALRWSELQLKAFAAMLKQVGITTIVFTKTPNKYYNSVIQCLDLRFDFVNRLLPDAKAVLSEEPDMLLIANVISHARLISKPLRSEFNLAKNNKFLGRVNDIYMIKELTPLVAFNAVRGDL